MIVTAQRFDRNATLSRVDLSLCATSPIPTSQQDSGSAHKNNNHNDRQRQTPQRPVGVTVGVPVSEQSQENPFHSQQSSQPWIAPLTLLGEGFGGQGGL